MPKKQPTPKWVQDAASIKVSNPNLMITQAMHATGQFSKEECKHRGLQMAVQRYCNNITSTETPPAYIAHPTANSNNESVASSLTPSTSMLFQPSMPEIFWQMLLHQEIHPFHIHQNQKGIPNCLLEQRKFEKHHRKLSNTESTTRKK